MGKSISGSLIVTHVLITSVVWLLAVGGSLLWNFNESRKGDESLALQSAQSFFRQIVLDRSWNALHGRVYVPVTSKVQPNPYLKTPFRDVTTMDGHKLTMINPAFMTRQIAELADSNEGFKFHITSLKPIRPENGATKWEEAWLHTFEGGAAEQYELVRDRSGYEFRYMAPLFVRAPCLNCHEEQGYKEGDIRGGISVTLPFSSPNMPWTLLITHGIGLAFGLMGIFYSGSVLNRGRRILVGSNAILEGENKERRQAEEALKKSEGLYRALIETTAAVAWEVDIKTLKFTYVSPKAEDIFGYPKEEWKDFAFWAEHIHPEDREHAVSFCQAKTEKGENHEFEYRFLAADGRTVWTRDIVSVIRSDDEPVALRGYLLDITQHKEAAQEKHELEEKLRQAQKMESIGTLAGGIAHDFNNILAPIFAYAGLAKMLPTSDKENLQNYLDEVLGAANRARELASQILTFSRQDTQQNLPLEMDVVVKEALKLLRASIPANIDIRQEIDPHCGLVMANPTQIHQVLLNLCTNAYHSMQEEGGVLTVLLRPSGAGQGGAEQDGRQVPGRYLSLEVTDTGHGMDEETLGKIFEPYFTTKARGEGSGMGLAVVHGIVKNSGGRIEVSSEVGKGTAFTVYLPVIKSEVSPVDSGRVGGLPRGSERILLVDDEKAIVKAGKLLLERLGYSVVTYLDPLEALEYFRGHQEEVDLLITDMSMPGMKGDRLASEVLGIRADIPVIICTGFSEGIDVEKAGSLGIGDLLQKPVTVNELALAVRRILDRGGSSGSSCGEV